MKVKEINEDMILFDNGNKITFDHKRDWCEYNHAQFDALDDIGMNTDFDENLVFQPVEYGFMFGNLPNKMFFIPCYSEQDGYYTDLIDIYYNGKKVIENLECE